MSGPPLDDPSSSPAETPFDLPDGAASAAKSFPDRPLHVLLATTGSVASVKAPLIVEALLKHKNVEVQVVATRYSKTFYDPEKLETDAEALGKSVKVWQNEDEWTSWKKIGNPILHIELRRWADIVLIAPLDANTLAKLAGGICDNLLTSLMRALDGTKTDVYVFPAMNTFMYDHPLTQPQLAVLENTLKYNVVGPVGKTLACGDIGIGAMTEWTEIVRLVAYKYNLEKSR